MESMHAKEECKRLRANVAESRDKLADLDAKVISLYYSLISFRFTFTETDFMRLNRCCLRQSRR